MRAFVAPLYLVATVVLSYAFALGASSLLFTHVLGQPASDPALPTFAFVFLVALGVDYNVFLISRIREERERRDCARRGDQRPGALRRRDHQRRPDPRRHVPRAGRRRHGLAGPGRLHGRAGPARGHVPRALLPRPGDRRGARRPQLVAAAAGGPGGGGAHAAAVVASRVAPDQASAPHDHRHSVADSGPGTLREALEAAEADGRRRDRRAAPPGTIDLRSQLPDLHSRARRSPAPAPSACGYARADAEHPFRLLTVGPDGDVAVQRPHAHRRLRRASARTRAAAACSTTGRLALREVVVAGNTVEGRIGVTGGGGVANTGTLELVRSARPRQPRDARAKAARAAAACTTSARCWSRPAPWRATSAPRRAQATARPASSTRPGMATVRGSTVAGQRRRRASTTTSRTCSSRTRR